MQQRVNTKRIIKDNDAGVGAQTFSKNLYSSRKRGVAMLEYETCLWEEHLEEEEDNFHTTIIYQVSNNAFTSYTDIYSMRQTGI